MVGKMDGKMERERRAARRAQQRALASAPKDDQLVEVKVPDSLLKVAQEPLLSSLAYSRAVEAAVSAAKRGIAKEDFSDWRDAAVRILQSRSNSPLALLWALIAFHKSILNSEESGNNASVGSLISVAQSLLHSLKFMTAGFCSGPTAIAAAAPIVQIVVSSLATATRSENDPDLSQKKKEKLWRSLQKLIFELSGFITLCHHKDAPVAHGLFKAPSVNLGLDIWLSEESNFSSLFPFATQVKVHGFLNSIESVLHLGEIVETEVALLRLVTEIVQHRLSPNSSNKEELERKLKQNVILYSKFLGSSAIILDMLLDAPLQLGGILKDEEELVLRNVLGEMAVLPTSEIFGEDRSALSAGDTVGRDSVAFLKRVIIARQLAADFRSRNEYLRASDLLAGLHRRGAPSSLGEWLGDRSSLRLLISTDVLRKPQALLDWLLNASHANFDVVLDKTYIERPKAQQLVGSMDLEEAQDPDTSLFFIDTSKTYDKDTAEAGFDANQAYLMATADMQVATKDDVLFDRSEQFERKRTRGAARSKAEKAKQRKDSNGAKVTELTGEDITTDSEDLSMSEDESEEESEMSE